MPDILHRIVIAAPSDRVLKTITTTPGVQSWWTSDCVARPEKGHTNVFRFMNGAVEFHFRVDEMSEKGTLWTGIEASKMPEEWVGTKIRVDLAPTDDGGTRLEFAHLNWRKTDGEFPACNTVWGDLMHRLKDSAEGRPRGPYFEG